MRVLVLSVDRQRHRAITGGETGDIGMLTSLSLEGFKSWKKTGEIALKPITGFFGPNSSGKTSLIQALLLLKQTVDSADRRLVFHFGSESTPADLGDYRSIIHDHD